MCKVNIAVCDKVTTPHRGTLHCWPPNILLLDKFDLSNYDRASMGGITSQIAA